MGSCAVTRDILHAFMPHILDPPQSDLWNIPSYSWILDYSTPKKREMQQSTGILLFCVFLVDFEYIYI